MVHATGRGERGGWSFRRLQKPCQTTLGIFPRLNVPTGTVADLASAPRGAQAFQRWPEQGKLVQYTDADRA